MVGMGLQLYMPTAAREGFGGEVKGHGDELRGRLLTIQKQLDFGLDHLQKQGLEMPAAYIRPTKEAYDALLKT